MNVAIAQSDVVTAYGWGVDALWDGLMSNRTAIVPTERFAGRGFISRQAALVPGLQPGPGDSRAFAMLGRLLAPLAGKLDAATPLILATTVGEIDFVERAVMEDRPELAAHASPQALLGRVKELLGLRGPAMAVSAACASSAAALTRAASLVRGGEAPAALVVTCDAVSEFVYSGFSTLLSLSETPARPFDAARNGLTLGEAAAWALLAPSGAASILGWGNTTDAVHMTAPDRDAGGLRRAIAKACAMAGRSAGDVAFIAAHGTATVYSDAMEMRAFREAMGAAKPTFSIKGGIGHTLGAAGLVQILVAQRAMELGRVPPTVGLSTPAPDAIGWADSRPVRLGPYPLALSTNSGFGGVNTAVLLGGVAPS